MQPRHFWRRAFAFMIDFLIASFIATWLSFMLHWAAPNHFVVLDGLIKSTECQLRSWNGVGLPEGIPDGFFEPSDHVRFKLCIHRPYFLEGGATITAFTDGEDYMLTQGGILTLGFKLNQRSVQYSVDKTLNAIQASDYREELTAFIMLLVWPLILYLRNGQSFGKDAMDLQLVPANSSDMKQRPLTSYVTREALKLILMVVQVTFVLTMVILPQSGVSNVSILLFLSDLMKNYVFICVFFIALLAWYVLPLVRWRGQMVYDKITGFKVIHINDSELE